MNIKLRIITIHAKLDSYINTVCLQNTYSVVSDSLEKIWRIMWRHSWTVSKYLNIPRTPVHGLLSSLLWLLLLLLLLWMLPLNMYSKNTNIPERKREKWYVYLCLLYKTTVVSLVWCLPQASWAQWRQHIRDTGWNVPKTWTRRYWTSWRGRRTCFQVNPPSVHGRTTRRRQRRRLRLHLRSGSLVLDIALKWSITVRPWLMLMLSLSSSFLIIPVLKSSFSTSTRKSFTLIL